MHDPRLVACDGASQRRIDVSADPDFLSTDAAPPGSDSRLRYLVSDANLF